MLAAAERTVWDWELRGRSGGRALGRRSAWRLLVVGLRGTDLGVPEAPHTCRFQSRAPGGGSASRVLMCRMGSARLGGGGRRVQGSDLSTQRGCAGHAQRQRVRGHASS